MVLTIGDYNIREINGPTEMYFLQPIIPNLPQKYIILFSDEHNKNNYKFCDDNSCVELATDFIVKLNNFAEQIKCSFYIEAFFKNYNDPLIKKLTTALYDNPEDEVILEHNLTKKTTQMEKGKIIYTAPRSNMIDMINIYRDCFEKKNCKYNNISWQYADIRSDKLKTSLTDFDKLASNINMGKFLNYDPNYTYLDLVDIFQNEELDFDDYHYTYEYLLLFNDIGEYTTRLMESPLINEQFRKMSPACQEIFNVASFTVLVQNNVDYVNFMRDPDFIKTTMSKFTAYLHYLINVNTDIRNDNDFGDDLSPKSNLTPPYNPKIEFSSAEIEYINWLNISIVGSLLDIYFILRMYKASTDATPELVIGYFGGNHTKSISEYLTRMNTHTSQYMSGGENIRRVSIVNNIDLNQIFGYTRDLQKESTALIIHPNPDFRRGWGGNKTKKSKSKKSKSKKSKSKKSKKTKKSKKH